MKNNTYFSLIIWVVALITIGSVIGSLTKPEIGTWYSTLNRAPQTPPNYVFPIAWTILYGMMGICGWILWHTQSFSRLKIIKFLYIIQLILNWSWTLLFFQRHLIGISLMVLVIMDVLTSIIVYLTYAKIKSVSWLMTVYLLWILFATYLNFYIWQYN